MKEQRKLFSSENNIMKSNSQPDEIQVYSTPDMLKPPDTESRTKIAIAIPLSKDKVTLISKEDASLAEQSWHFRANNGYAQRQIREGGKKKYILLHREVAQRMLERYLSHKDFIEHINGDKLDNRRENILHTTASEHIQRYNISKNNKSGYKGVTFSKRENKWSSNITIYGHRKSLGYYKTKEDAARAYNEAAQKYYGKHAKLNEILTEEHTINKFDKKNQHP